MDFQAIARPHCLRAHRDKIASFATKVRYSGYTQGVSPQLDLIHITLLHLEGNSWRDLGGIQVFVGWVGVGGWDQALPVCSLLVICHHSWEELTLVGVVGVRHT